MRLNNHEQNNETITKNAKLVAPRLCSNQKISPYSVRSRYERNNDWFNFTTKELERQEVEVVDLDKRQGQEVTAL